MENYLVYTDGSAIGQDKKFKTGEPIKGGYGYRVISPDNGILFQGGGGRCDHTVTNNRMEMLAVLQVLRTIVHNKEMFNSKSIFTIKTDSKYVEQCFNEYLPGWKKNGWTKKKGAIMNLDLWKALDKATNFLNFKIEWVKGHDVDEHNNAVDLIAHQFAVTAVDSSELAPRDAMVPVN